MEEMAALPNPESVRERIDSALETLGNLSSAKVSRAEVMEQLAKDLSDYYGYLPELTELLLNLFSPAECVEYMDASDRPRPLVIRTNTLKTTRKDLMDALTKRGAAVEAIDWSKVAIKVSESTVPIGATPEYLAGHYMLQSASSMNPVMALAPLPGEKVLDISSAPGGKSSYIAQLMKNSGSVIANDLKPQRQKATVANLHRLGVKNTVVCCYDGRKVPQVFKGFDRVLLDAPCSGLGIIARDQSVKLQRSIKDIQRVAHLQKELLRAAIDVVDANSSTGGYIVYSTCSISVEENEQVVNYILQKRFVKLVDTGLQVGKPGLTRHMERRFHPSLTLTRRFYPHVHNMDGFYVAKFKKYKNGVRGDEDDEKDKDDDSDLEGRDYDSGADGDEYDFGGEEEQDQEEQQEEEEEPVPEPEPEVKKSKKNAKQSAVKAEEKAVQSKEEVQVSTKSANKKRSEPEPTPASEPVAEEPKKAKKSKKTKDVEQAPVVAEVEQETAPVEEEPKVVAKKSKKSKQTEVVKEEEPQQQLEEDEDVEDNEPLDYSALRPRKRKALRKALRKN